MARRAFSILIPMLLAVVAGRAPADVPKIISYQGVLTLADGTVVPDAVDYVLRFAVFPTAVGGTALESWDLTVAVENGLYNVMLSEDTVPLSTIFDGSLRYMEVAIVSGGGLAGLPVVLTPRQEVASVPYALTSGVALEGGVIPSGVIVMWSGNPNEIPAGWALCDGNNNTPDLRGRFIVGLDPAGDADYQVPLATGGAKEVQLTIDEMPSHFHEVVKSDPNGVQIGFSDTGGGSKKFLRKGDAGDVDTDFIFTNSSGGSQAHENRPPYLVLAYIMKL